MNLLASATSIVTGASLTASASTDALVIGVSWSNFRGERCKPNEVAFTGLRTNPTADVLRDGQQKTIQAAIVGGGIKIVGEAFTDGQVPATPQPDMAHILTAADNKVDAAIVSNDGTIYGTLIGTVDVNDVTDDAFLSMIIPGKKPEGCLFKPDLTR